MTGEEIHRLLAFIVSMDGRNLTRLSADAWLEVLADTAYQPAHAAAVEHYRTSRDWITPAHILQGIRAQQGGNQPPRFDYAGELETAKNATPNTRAREYAQAIRDDLAERRALRQPPRRADRTRRLNLSRADSTPSMSE